MPPKSYSVKGIVYEAGTKLEAQDFMKKWYAARIMEVNVEKKVALLHFEGWSKRYDEWIAFGSGRLRPMTEAKPLDTRRGSRRAVTSPESAPTPTTKKGRRAASAPVTSEEGNEGRVSGRRGSRTSISSPKISTDNEQQKDSEEKTKPTSGRRGTTADSNRKSSDPKNAPSSPKKGSLDQSSSQTAKGSSGQTPLTTPSGRKKREKEVEEIAEAESFECPEENCNKSFRKASLLETHMKHYHEKPKATPKSSRGGTRSASESSTQEAKRDSSARLRTKRRRVGTAESLPATGVTQTNTTPVGLGYTGGSEMEEINSITQCMCGDESESEYMIQCERCNTWQHGECVGVSESTLPDHYLCFGCVQSWNKLDQNHSKAMWLPSKYKGRLYVENIPKPPTAESSANREKRDGAAIRNSKTKPLVDREVLVASIHRGMDRDLATLRRCMRAVRLLLTNMSSHGDPTKVMDKIAALEKQQNAFEYHLDEILEDSDSMDVLLGKASNSSLRLKTDPSEDLSELNRLYKKYDQRQWKVYVETAEGKVLK
eukprot:m.15624 g.15624  ORF g.15624 m.15624 type:complete len:542 (+) comp5453_c0_seq1:132-1757(+)